jgi:hypothetical protein
VAAKGVAIELEHFVFCISNYDQVGNNALRIVYMTRRIDRPGVEKPQSTAKDRPNCERPNTALASRSLE